MSVNNKMENILRKLETNKLVQVAFLISLVLFSIISRLEQFIPNFTAVTASVFFLALFSRKWSTTIIASIVILVSTDIIIGGYDFGTMISVYISTIMIGISGIIIRKIKRTFRNISLGLILSSILFYLVTNFSVWFFWPMMYERTFSGLLTCYYVALPFFRNAIIGDVFFFSVFFLSYLLIGKLVYNEESMLETKN